MKSPFSNQYLKGLTDNLLLRKRVINSRDADFLNNPLLSPSNFNYHVYLWHEILGAALKVKIKGSTLIIFNL